MESHLSSLCSSGWCSVFSVAFTICPPRDGGLNNQINFEIKRLKRHGLSVWMAYHELVQQYVLKLCTRKSNLFGVLEWSKFFRFSCFVLPSRIENWFKWSIYPDSCLLLCYGMYFVSPEENTLRCLAYKLRLFEKVDSNKKVKHIPELKSEGKNKSHQWKGMGMQIDNSRKN